MLFALAAALLLQSSPMPSPAAAPAASPSASASPAAAPSLTVAPAAANLHPGQSQTLQIGSGTGPFTTTSNTPIVIATVDQNAKTLTLTASQQTGTATVIVSDSTGTSVAIPVRVALDAGIVPASVDVEMTGNPVDAAWLQAQVQKALLEHIVLQPGAVPAIAPIFLPPALFAPGGSAAIPVTVQIPGGASYFSVNAVTSVTVENVAVDPFLPPLLFYDDDPEKVDAPGLIYRNQVTAAVPARLYYYHQDVAVPLQLMLVLSTAQNVSARVQLIDASAGPNPDVMSVGHAVSRNFLLEKPRDEGLVSQIAPESPYVADRFAMHPLDGAAGSVDIRVLSGGPVTVSVVSALPNASPSDVAAALTQPQLPGDGHHRTGVFSISAYAANTVAYTVGGPNASVDYGATTPPPAGGTVTGHDYGDYGVLRTINFDLANPSAQAAPIYLYERPLGGVVRSSFLVDGALVEVGCARLASRYQIGAPIVLAPGAQSTLRVQTMTDGGSNYPLEVGVSTVPPQPATPPISAPDGCFPKPNATSPPAAVPQPSPSGPVPQPSPSGPPAPQPSP